MITVLFIRTDRLSCINIRVIIIIYELLKIRTDIRQGGSFLCAITAPRGNASVCDT